MYANQSEATLSSDGVSPQQHQQPDSSIPSTPAGELIVVSNRQPYRHTETDDGITVDDPTGGLTAGLDPVLQRAGGAWIAWGDGDADRAVVDDDATVEVPPGDESYTLKRVWLTDEQERDYYYGFSNQVLWPICHGALTNVRCESSYWRRYWEVNQQFADAVADRADDRSVVWLQDYHLAMAPSFVRQRLPDAVVGHFWHIPWPSWDTFRACPYGPTILRGLLGNDLLGFHVGRYCRNFLECVESGIPDATVDWESWQVYYNDRVVRVAAIPLGVPVERIRRRASSPEAVSFVDSFKRENDVDPETRLAVGVDRLDYTKGIPERLAALERLWETAPGWRGQFTYVQIASPSRSRIPAYEQVQQRVTEEVDRINDRFGTDDWRPIVYTTAKLGQDELYGLYRRADIALVSPIRDGMNLVAQEYVAAQGSDEGVLLLSDQAGIHDVLGESAVTIRPFEVDGFACAIAEALTMAPPERRHRMNALRQTVDDIDLSNWTQRFFERITRLQQSPQLSR